MQYLYRGGGSCKAFDSIVVAGVLSEHEQKELRDVLSGGCFIPEQVGMPAVQTELKAYGSADDAWHEIAEISITDDPTTFPGTAHELLTKFKQTVWNPSSFFVDESKPTM